MAAVTRQQQRIFWIVLLAIPVLFFVLLEGGLRLFDYGENRDLFVPVEWKGEAYYAVNPAVARRYFSDPTFSTYVSRDRFLARKPLGTYRIFCLGASTTVGFPYMFNGSYSSLLRDRLITLFPDQRVEVVNVGITAVNSYTVADLARELMDYEPDLLVVYAGHNEFYGALGVGSAEFVGSRRWMVRLYLTLQEARTVRLLRAGLQAAAGAIGGGDQEGQQLMERMARDQQIRYASPTYEVAKAYFRANYDEVIELAQSRGVGLLISTLASNLRDQPPFVSVHSLSLSPADQARWEGFFQQARSAEVVGDYDAAVGWYQQAIALDSVRADAHYQLARCYEALGRPSEALVAYRQARDLDALRFRASSEFSEILRGLARDRGVPLVDMEAAFASESPHGIPGDSLFWEHVHPTLDGYLLMARAFAEGMATHGLMAPTAAWEAAEEHPEGFYRQFAGVTDFDHEVAKIRIELLKSRWPFRQQPVPFHYEPATPVQHAAWDYVRNEIGWASAHDRLAKAYVQAGEVERAAEELWAIAKQSSYDPHFAIVAADMEASRGHFDRAIDRYAFALRSEDTPRIRAKLGVASYEEGRYDRAAVHLEQALASHASTALNPPQRVQAHYLLARSYARLGDVTQARTHLERLRSLAPQAPPTIQLARELDTL